MKRLLLAATLLLATSVALVACGGDDDDDDDGDGTPTASGTASRTASSNPGGTPASGTPGGGIIHTPVAGTTLTPAEATVLASDIFGGDPAATPVFVSTIPVPTPAPGVTPIVDPTQIADPDPPTGEFQMFVDMDASTPGIQSTRDVNVGDVFRVAIVAANIPPVQNDVGGVAAFNFFLNYDKTKIVAPSIAGGPATDRNPDLNQAALGEELVWDCLPAPEGDTDDPGGIEGDGNPATGQALLSCFTFTPEAGAGGRSGTITLATVTFFAVASGTSTLELDDLGIGDKLGIGLAHCPGDVNEPYIPCQAGTVNVR